MVQNNKILTVSYGTFSCTLEGFDDSFETMKSIAEYFRDLAADDRYFGSEPPQPDAEMLARIARSDVSRQVEASHNDTGVLLRATDPTPVTPSQPLEQDKPVAEAHQTHATPEAFGSEPLADAPSTDAPAADSIAAKLQRIRAVVSHSDENSVIYTEDDDTALLSAAAGPKDAVAAAFEAGSLHSSDFEDEADTSTQPPVADLLPDTLAPAQENDQPEVAPKAIGKTDLEVPEDESIPQHEVTFTETQDEAKEDKNILNDLTDEDDGTEAEQGVLTAADEEFVLNDIAEVEAFLARRAADHTPESTSVDHDVSRLMQQADVQMDDPDTHSQRETYSHLRAAVAATEAERGHDTSSKSERTSDEQYNLDAEVSPRRPEVSTTSKRPQMDELAPLKLVAEQRVDARHTDTGPVTPRRVTSHAEDDSAEEGGFAQFAQEQGAQSLPDLLEAAAAYLSFIEGQEQFSRPQLMNKIRSLKQEDFNREESLRTFGQLLRAGKIEKAGGGRFAASTEINFRPGDARAAG